MAGKLEGQIALITGGSGGIGAATVRAFAEEGVAGIAIHYASARERAEALGEEVRARGSRAVVLQADVARRSEAHRLVADTVEALGGLDILVCFAGHPFLREEWYRPFEELSEEELLRPLRVDLLGSVYCAQAAAPPLRRSASGRVVLVSSTPALTGDVEGISYLLAKGALLSLTRALARLLGPAGVHANCLVLGSIDTEAMGTLTEAERRALVEETTLRRMGTPEEVARKVVYLASPDVSFQTGIALVVDGGFVFP